MRITEEYTKISTPIKEVLKKGYWSEETSDAAPSTGMATSIAYKI